MNILRVCLAVYWHQKRKNQKFSFYNDKIHLHIIKENVEKISNVFTGNSLDLDREEHEATGVTPSTGPPGFLMLSSS